MFFSRTSFRIAFWYALSFIVASILIFVLMGLFLANLLQTKDRELLQTKFQAFAEIIENEGPNGLHNASAAKKVPDSRQFYVRYSDDKGKTQFLHIPQDNEFDATANAIRALEDFLNQHANATWFIFPGQHYGGDIELVSGKLEDGGYLQVGKDIEDRKDFLKGYLRSFVTVFFPILLVAIAFGLVLTSKLLQPIRWLMNTVTGIQKGDTGARVPVRGGQDELDQLAKIFNQMLDRNQHLIKTMKESLDNVSHDLRTPVMRLRSSVENALTKKGDENSLKEALSDALENSSLILNILNATMDISEAEAGTLRLEKQKIVVSEFLTYLLEMYRYVASDMGFTIETSFSDNTEVLADYVRMVQAVGNLIDNAFKYSPEGSTISVGTRLENGLVEIFVRDHGPGINPDEVEKIWDRFYRGDASRSSRGMGLGLSLVRAIALAHGGAVTYTPRTGGGSIFRIILPQL